MSFVGHVFELFAYDIGLLGWLLLGLLAVGSMWLGYKFSRPSDSQLSIRRPPPTKSREE